MAIAVGAAVLPGDLRERRAVRGSWGAARGGWRGPERRGDTAPGFGGSTLSDEIPGKDSVDVPSQVSNDEPSKVPGDDPTKEPSDGPSQVPSPSEVPSKGHSPLPTYWHPVPAWHCSRHQPGPGHLHQRAGGNNVYLSSG